MSSYFRKPVHPRILEGRCAGVHVHVRDGISFDEERVNDPEETSKAYCMRESFVILLTNPPTSTEPIIYMSR